MKEKKFYLDTCIWRDYFEDRKDNLKPLGEFAFQFLKKCVKENAVIFVSDLVVMELQKEYSSEQIESMFLEFIHLIVRITHLKEQFKEAFNVYEKFDKRLPFYDILHSIVARDKNAILVSRDNHFKKINLCRTELPEELL